MVKDKDYDERDSEEIRNLILSTLHDIRDMISLDFDIEVKPNTEYGEDIIMRLPSESSGISKPGSKENGETYTRSGAQIVFNQIYSNGSEVSYKMSHIEGLSEEAKKELQEKSPREQITRQYIMNKVITFLQDVVDFEK